MNIHNTIRALALAIMLATPACDTVEEDRKPVSTSTTTTEETTTVHPLHAPTTTTETTTTHIR